MNPIKALLTDVLGARKDNFDWRVHTQEIDLGGVDEVCVLSLHDKLGDTLLISLLVDALAKARPGLRIRVGTSPLFAPYWDSHPCVAEAIAFPGVPRRASTVSKSLRWWLQAKPWRGRFDVVVSFQPYARPEHFAMLRSLRARSVVGFNKHAYRLFDHSLDEHRHGVANAPIATRAASVMRVFGHYVDVRSLEAHVPVRAQDARAAERALASLPQPGLRALLNAYGTGREKVLSPASVARAASEIRRLGHSGPLFVSVPKGREEAYECALRAASLQSPISVIGPRGGLFGLFALVAAVDVVFSPDTGLSHVAAALRKPQVCVFATGGSVPVVWRPLSEFCAVVVSDSGRDVNDLDWDAFADAARWALAEADFLARLDAGRGHGP